MNNNISIKMAISSEEINLISKTAKEIWLEAFTDIATIDQLEYMIEKFQSSDAIKNQIDNENILYFIVYKDEKIAGYTALKLCENSLFVSKLYILKPHRSSVITDTLFDFIDNYAKDNNKNKIWLNTNKNNLRAIRAYQKRNFSIIDSKCSDIGNGYVMDDYILEKSL